MKTIPDRSIDFVLSDPPYGINYRSNQRTERFDHIANDRDTFPLIEAYLSECQRILKDDTAIYLFCSWHHIDKFKPLFERFFTMKNLLVWNKNGHGMGDLQGSYGPKHELILFGHKGRSLNRGKRLHDVIDCPKIGSTVMVHPTEKPVKLLTKLILNSSDEGDIVFDGFAGAGSTCIAANRLSRKFIGVELDARYHATATERVHGMFTSIGTTGMKV